VCHMSYVICHIEGVGLIHIYLAQAGSARRYSREARTRVALSLLQHCTRLIDSGDSGDSGDIWDSGSSSSPCSCSCSCSVAVPVPAFVSYVCAYVYSHLSICTSLSALNTSTFSACNASTHCRPPPHNPPDPIPILLLKAVSLK
jgi:hypothetical protein